MNQIITAFQTHPILCGICIMFVLLMGWLGFPKAPPAPPSRTAVGALKPDDPNNESRN